MAGASVPASRRFEDELRRDADDQHAQRRVMTPAPPLMSQVLDEMTVRMTSRVRAIVERLRCTRSSSGWLAALALAWYAAIGN